MIPMNEQNVTFNIYRELLIFEYIFGKSVLSSRSLKMLSRHFSSQIYLLDDIAILHGFSFKKWAQQEIRFKFTRLYFIIVSKV